MTVPFAYVATDLFAGSSSPLQKCIKRVEAFEPATQDFFVWQALFAPTFEHAINPHRFPPLKSGVVQIGVVNHLADFRNRSIRNGEAFRQRFKRAVVPVVREFSVEHVEWDGVRNRIRSGRKNKSW